MLRRDPYDFSQGRLAPYSHSGRFPSHFAIEYDGGPSGKYHLRNSHIIGIGTDIGVYSYAVKARKFRAGPPAPPERPTHMGLGVLAEHDEEQ